jgi:hypothetical protein
MLVDARVVSMGNAGSNSLQAYGLNFDALNILQEYGLIIADYNSFMDYRMAIIRGTSIDIPFTHQNRTWGLTPKTEFPLEREFHVFGVSFSRAGRELLSIVDIDPNEQYTAALKEFFDKQGMTMTGVAVTNPG